ncbi:ATP-binding protein, partial [Desulfococcaceae bacterium HSG8]|nr:ATP-binding protein [Desulfococcaceae bacterium HSG8]
VPKTREAKLFIREAGNFEIGNNFKEGKGLDTKTRDNALFLSVVAQFNGQISKTILKWFRNFNIISGFEEYGDITIKYMEKGESCSRRVSEFLAVADLGILSANIAKAAALPANISQSLRTEHMDIKTLHQKYDENRKAIGFENFELEENESKGTQKIFSLAGPILNALDRSEILLIDEMDAGLHPLIAKFIIQLFNSEDNPNNAQLILNTHNIYILNSKLFRSDQIWFAEKDRYGGTDLYSLFDYKVKNDDSYGDDYILGRYGAIPCIDADELRSSISSVEGG